MFVLGTILMRSAGCCVNDVADRDFDKHVKRTAQRPVTTGAGVRRRKRWAWARCWRSVSFGLVLTTNMAAVLWSVPAVLVAIAYPFTKRIIAMPQAVLGIAFNFGIVIAFAAVQGSVPAVAWWMWLGNLFWVLAYDTEIRHGGPRRRPQDRHQDLGHHLGRLDVAGISLFYLLFLGIWAVALAPMRWALFLCSNGRRPGAGRVAFHADPRRTREGCFKAFPHQPLAGRHGVCGHCARLPVAVLAPN